MDLENQLIEILGEPLPDFTPANHPTIRAICKWEQSFKFVKVFFFKNGEIVATAGDKTENDDDYDIFPNLSDSGYTDLAHGYKAEIDKRAA